jgi:hypothetical protein
MMNKPLMLTTFLMAAFFSVSALATETHKPAKADFFKVVDNNADGKVTQAEFIAAMEKKFHSMDVDKSDVVSVEEFKVYGEKLPPDNKDKNAKLIATVKMLSKEDFVRLFDKRAEQEFSQLDKNHDNQLSAAELGVSQKKPKKSSKKTVTEKLLGKEDFIALFRKHAAAAFASLDKSHDHQLSDAELGQPKPTVPTAPKVTSQPQPQPKPPAPLTKQQKLVNSLFVGIDANNDGLISYAEKNAAFIRFFNHLDTNHDQLITPDEIIAARYKSSANPHSNVTTGSP